MKNSIEVFLNEEYGYKRWIWTPNMNEEEFVAWWNDLTESEFIKYYFNIKALPGTLKPYNDKGSGTSQQREYGDPKTHMPYYYCLFHDVDDSYIAIGKTNYRFKNRGRYDWKDYWMDYSLRKEKSSKNYINP
jgi:hypothetical protein